MGNNTDVETTYLRFSGHSGTCSNGFSGFLDGLFTKIQDTFFFVFVLQFGLVSLMYYNIGRGKYWKILFWASLANFYGAIVENSTVAFICRESVKDKEYKWVFPFLLAEIGWIIGEYSIPILNLTKMKTFSEGIFEKIVYYLIMGLFLPLFIACRLFIGYNRMKYGVLTTTETKYGHAAAFSIMAISDVTCTIAILYFVRKNNSQEEITHYIKKTSYTILLCVDVVGILLAVANGISEYFDCIPGSTVNPFHCIKCSVILILAVDALLFKYNHTMNTIHEPTTDDDDDNNGNVSNTNYTCSLTLRTNNYVIDSSDFNIHATARI